MYVYVFLELSGVSTEMYLLLYTSYFPLILIILLACLYFFNFTLLTIKCD